MILSKLTACLHRYSIKWHQQFSSDTEIYSFHIVKPETIYQPNILYVGRVSELPASLPNIEITILAIPDQPLPAKYENEIISNLNLITIYNINTTSDVLCALSDILSNDARVTNGKGRLIEALHSNKGMQAIIDVSYDILQNPIILVDTSYKIIAMFQDIVFEREDLEIQRKQGYMLESNIEAMKKAKLYEIAREKGYPYYSKDNNDTYGWITALVYIHGIEVAQIGVMDSHHPLTEADFDLVHFLCKIVSLEFQKSDFYRTNRGFMHSFFLFDLLDNQIHDMKTIAQRVQNLNWSLTNSMGVLVLSDSGRGFFEGKAQLISKQLNHLLPGSHWVVYDRKIVFLLNEPDERLLQTESTLTEYLQINHLTASVSKSFDSILEIRTFYNQALKAYKLGQKYHKENVIYKYKDYTIYHIIEIIAESHNLTNFYHPGIVRIQEYDRVHNTNFIETLKLYLHHVNQPELVAKKLFIHKNTVFYRISRIKELFQINLEDGEERLKIQLTIKFMQSGI